MLAQGETLYKSLKYSDLLAKTQIEKLTTDLSNKGKPTSVLTILQILNLSILIVRAHACQQKEVIGVGRAIIVIRVCPFGIDRSDCTSALHYRSIVMH